MSIPDIFPVKVTYSPVLVSLQYTPRRSASGSVASTMSAPTSFASFKASSNAFGDSGFENVYVVKEQELPDGNFPTVAYPNPESPKAFELALKLAKEVDADIVLATDPL